MGSTASSNVYPFKGVKVPKVLVVWAIWDGGEERGGTDNFRLLTGTRFLASSHPEVFLLLVSPHIYRYFFPNRKIIAQGSIEMVYFEHIQDINALTNNVPITKKPLCWLASQINLIISILWYLLQMR